MLNRINKNEADLKIASARITQDELSTMKQILDALDSNCTLPADIRPEGSARIICWNKPAEEISQALAQMSSRYQDLVEEPG